MKILTTWGRKRDQKDLKNNSETTMKEETF